MFGFRDISLERKLKLITMVTSGTALVIACVGIITYDFISFRRMMARDLAALAELTAQYCALGLSIDYKKDVTDALNALTVETHIIGACVYGKDGREFACYTRKGLGDVFTPLPPRNEGHQFTPDRLGLFRPIVLEGDVIGTIYLESDLAELKTRLRTYGASVFCLMAAALLAASIFASRLQRTISQPLLQLAQTARTVSKEKNYSVRAAKQGNDEVGSLIDGFNQMLGQIQESDQALRQAQNDLEKRVEERTGELQLEIAERKQAEGVVQQQLTRISLLNRITHAISERQDVQSILSIVLEQLEQHLPACSGAFYLFDAGKQTLSLAAFRKKSRREHRSRFSAEVPLGNLESSVLSDCLKGLPVCVADASALALPIFQPQPPAVQSVVVVPLMVESKLFGLLISGRTEPDAFSSGECEFLKMLSEQVALAGHHAQLYTELQAAYDELRQTQHAVMQHERLRALGQMASGIAHDINNALSPIVGFAELLLATERNVSPTSRRYLEHIRTASTDIAHIVARLREFYRRREDARDLKPVDVNTIVTQVIDLTRPRWRDMSQERGISITVEADLSPTLPRTVGIESELREALTNVILNAVDALIKDGRITIRTTAGWPGNRAVSESRSYVVIEVLDDGVGMDEDTRRRCLEPFFSTKGVRGTGLGLAMVYGIMERHDGKIEVLSERGRGTTIRLLFPVHKTDQPSPPVLEEEEAELEPLHILFVDDEPLLRQLGQSMFENDGHTVVVADGGQSGLAEFRSARARGEPFDAVITDLGMPLMDGRKLAQLLKEESPQTPVIMLTGWGTLMRADGDKPAQVDCVLSKPPRIKELRAALHRVLNCPETAQPA